MNGRNFTRVNCSVGASISYGDDVIACSTGNLSLLGIYLNTEHDLPLNVPVHVTVYHSSQSSFNVNAMVVRKETNGVGLQITKLNAKSFIQLRDIVTEKHNDYMKVMTETLNMVKCIC